MLSRKRNNGAVDSLWPACAVPYARCSSRFFFGSFVVGNDDVFGYTAGSRFSAHGRRHECVRLDGDTFFPEFEDENWELINEEYHGKDNRHKHDFTYQTFVRKR